MTDTPWTGDACSLVDAFRSGERSPTEELDATFAAIDASQLNAFVHLDRERACRVAATADVTKPFGGVPDRHQGAGSGRAAGRSARARWSSPIASPTALRTPSSASSIAAVRCRSARPTASEFGGLNVSVTKIHGVTHNPWRFGRTVGGSSAGSAAAVAGGLVSLATGGDGGGSIRIPAGYTGLARHEGHVRSDPA